MSLVVLMEMYKLDFPNGKSYIGITKHTAEKRLKTHIYNASRKKQLVSKAIMKYGHESIVCRTLLIADDWKYLCKMEEKAIDSYKTRHPGGYNTTFGGEGGWNVPVPEKMRKAASKRMVDLHQDPEFLSLKKNALSKLWKDPAFLERRRQKRIDSMHKGEWKNPLTTDDSKVKEVHDLKSSGLTQCQAAEKAKVTQTLVYRIWNLKAPKGPLFRLGLIDEHGNPVEKTR